MITVSNSINIPSYVTHHLLISCVGGDIINWLVSPLQGPLQPVSSPIVAALRMIYLGTDNYAIMWQLAAGTSSSRDTAGSSGQNCSSELSVLYNITFYIQINQ